MSNAEIVSLVGTVTAIILSVVALVKAHSTPAQDVDAVLKATLASPVIVSEIETLAKRLSPDVLTALKDAGLLVTTIATGANTTAAPSQANPTAKS
jgi:methylmalonyl-CoA mutase cobalamin-binding subunit